jgi:hypothetical protein
MKFTHRPGTIDMGSDANLSAGSPTSSVGSDKADGLDGALLDTESAFDTRIRLDDERFILVMLGVESYVEHIRLGGAAVVAIAAADAQLFIDKRILMGCFHGLVGS